ncbi:MAG: sigma-54-dependent Fis family transcriptional regulator [Nitrospirae bacterium]|nr:sigma-54-dependent Fis family transcriptional regulator [Nitrospirota bacterium]
MSNSALPIVLIDDEQEILFSYSVTLKSAGIEHILTVQDSRQALPLLKEQDVAVVVLDLIMPYLSGTELLTKINRDFPHIPVIIMTAVNELERAVECMKAGASDYLVKPVEKSRFISSIQRALELRNLRNEVSSLRQHLLTDQLEHEEVFSSIITKSKKMRAVFHYLEAIAKSPKPVFITGETGTGKELIAKSIHQLSGLKGSFIAVNVAGLDDTMFSDTLFGHKKGAFTGADKERDGLIVQASEGTLLLDEIGDLNESSQIKLLRLLEEKTYYPLGSDISEKSNARIIANSNHDIQKQISDGKFRKDLYYRLCSHHIHIPPLRERLEDVPLLINYFLEDAARSLKKRIPSTPPDLITLLLNYPYPGNIRELQAVIFDAVTQHKSGVLSLDSFKKFIKQKSPPELLPKVQDVNSMFDISAHFPTLKEVEDYLISEALKRSNNNQGIAASLLGITRQALNKRLTRKKPK